MTTLTFDGKHLGFDHPNPDPSFRNDLEWVFAIVSDYLQPNTQLSLDAAITSIDKHDSFDNRYLTPLIHVVIELIEQIPFDHPAMPKLAELLTRFYTRPEWAEKESRLHADSSADVAKRAFTRLREQLSIALYDRLVYPDQIAEFGEDPLIYVSECAFRANLGACDDFFFYYAARLQQIPFQALEDDDGAWEMRQGIGDAYVMGAAVHVLQSPGIMVERVRNCEKAIAARIRKPLDVGKSERDGNLNESDDASCWRLGRIGQRLRAREQAKGKAKAQMKLEAEVRKWPYTWELWEKWERLLQDAAGNSLYGERARKMAEEAAGKMMEIRVGEREKHNRSATSVGEDVLQESSEKALKH